VSPTTTTRTTTTTTTKQNLDPRCTYVHAGKNILSTKIKPSQISRPAKQVETRLKISSVLARVQKAISIGTQGSNSQCLVTCRESLQ
jgi:hypothetical protein